jgi:hypothetical protein
MKKEMIYPGLDQDHFGGMTPIGHIIRDAWVFRLLPETETCTHWTHDRLEQLYDQVAQAWQPFGHLASRLPDDLRARHERIYAEAIRRARELGWSAEMGDED